MTFLEFSDYWRPRHYVIDSLVEFIIYLVEHTNVVGGVYMAKQVVSFTDTLMADNAKGRKCDLSRALTRMTPEMSAQVRAAMAAPEVTAAAISRTLQRFKFDVTEGSVRRCRRTCKCWRA